MGQPARWRVGIIRLDGEPLPLDLPAETTVASAFEVVRDHVLAHGRIVTDVEIGAEPVTWQDGSPGWDEPFETGPDLVMTTDYPLNISAPLIDKVIGMLPEVAGEHRAMAEAFRASDPTAPERSAQLLGVWKELEHAIDQICLLHNIDLSASPWSELAGQFRSRFQKLEGSMRELRESLSLRDMVLVADLLEFELAPLAEEFVAPCQEFANRLRTHFAVPKP